MTTPGHTRTTAIHPQISAPAATVMAVLYGLLLIFVLAACGSGRLDEAMADTDTATDELIETARSTEVPTGDTVETVISATTQIVFVDAGERGDEPFVPTAEIAECRPEELIDFLESNPRIAAAWAEAGAVSVDAIAETIRSFEPTILDHDTLVTNHAYRGGVARGFQATLQAGTAVFVDDAGVPRVRCACGNPLGRARSPRRAGAERHDRGAAGHHHDGPGSGSHS